MVLGGDPKQLGPVIHSPAAKKHGLSTSLLERLLARPMYAKSTTGRHLAFNGYNPNYITMLIRNYRSHELLLQVPNALFYDGALQACVKSPKVNFSKSPKSQCVRDMSVSMMRARHVCIYDQLLKIPQKSASYQTYYMT